MQQIKVLLADDSALIRQTMARLLGEYPDLHVAATAYDGEDALRKIAAIKPDVVSLDVEMPRMDGITALRLIMKERPLPVIMFSTLTSEGSRQTVEALSAGAFDFVTKPSSPAQLKAVVAELAGKIRLAYRARAGRSAGRMPPVRRPAPAGAFEPRLSGPAAEMRGGDGGPSHGPEPPQRVPPEMKKRNIDIVVIGCSTGGPAALQQVIPALPAGFPVPVVVVQHIPPGFSKHLAEHLDRKSPLKVVHAEHGTRLEPGCVLVAPAGFDLEFKRGNGYATVSLLQGSGPPPPGGFRPSVDGVMTSAARLFGERVLGVLMTGMGRDGAKGMKEIVNRNGCTIAEDESTCVVFGMPRAAIESGAADFTLPLPRIAQGVMTLVGLSSSS
ncbi:MAG: chemotaxis response regulator protein-glutamate methylesterase [Firmicutes bacterium]|nr:chemotaxis response regulator protein-glutamate methylesterase [Bacillota bacterium]